MNIINLNGGLGNQLFQYSFGMAMKYNYYMDIKFCNKFLNSKQLNINDVFDIEISFADVNDLNKIIGRFYSNHLIRGIALRTLNKLGVSNFKNFVIENYKSPITSLPSFKNKFYYGYWQNFNFFYENLDKIKNNLKFKFNKGLKNKFEKLYKKYSDVVCLHVRLGDYKSQKNQKVFSKISSDYYHNSISVFSKNFENPIFILFTNETDKVDRSILNHSKVVLSSSYFDIDQSYDFFLMSMCDAYVFSNSTFSLWAAYLSQKKNIFFTKPFSWYKDSNIERANRYYPNDWVCLNK
tara:strand:- start:437 stop:1318 length:882 start_codon:yes stop_codon:yes gene_type:complete